MHDVRGRLQRSLRDVRRRPAAEPPRPGQVPLATLARPEPEIDERDGLEFLVRDFRACDRRLLTPEEMIAEIGKKIVSTFSEMPSTVIDLVGRRTLPAPANGVSE